MKHNLEKDNLENLFDRIFNEEAITADPSGWNVPSDNIWEQIEEELPPKETPVRVLAYWRLAAIAASLLLLVGFFQLYQSNQKIEQLASQLETNEQLVKDIRSKIQIAEQQASTQVPQEATTEATNIKESTRLAKKQQTPKSIIKTASNTDIAYNPIVLQSKKIEPSINSSILKENEFMGIVKQRNKTIFPTSVDFNRVPNFTLPQNIQRPFNNGNVLNRLASLVDRDDRILIPQLPNAIAPLPIAKRPQEPINIPVVHPQEQKGDWLVAVDMSPVWKQVKQKNNPINQDQLLPEKELRNKAYTAGVQIGKEVGNGWFVESGVRYTKANYTAKHQRILNIANLEERVGVNGQLESQVNFLLGSSSGISEAAVVLSRTTTAQVADNTPLHFDIAQRFSTAHIEVPIVGRKQWLVGNLGLSIRAGLLNRFLFEKATYAPSIDMDDKRFYIETNKITAHSSSNIPSTYSAHVLTGMEVAYAITPDLSIYLSPTFIRSLESKTVADGESLQEEQTAMHVGVRYRL